MAEPYQNDQHGRSDPRPAADAALSSRVPPVLPPGLPSAQKRAGLSPWAIIAICVAGVALFLAMGVFVLGMLGARRYAQAKESAARQTQANQARAAAARAALTREIKPNRARSESGLTYTNERVAGVPWSIHVVQIDRSRKDLILFSAHAKDQVLGVSFIEDQARAVPREVGRALAGVNGDFYERDNATYAGDPRGLQIVNGDLLSAPGSVCVWFDADGNPHLDDVQGDFNVIWPDGRKTPFGLNQRRGSRMAVLYTPTYGASTRVMGGRELILEKDGNGPWLPLQASQTYRARVREISTTGNTRLTAEVMVLSLGPQLLAGLPGVTPGAVLQISTATTPELKGAKAAIAGGPALIQNGKPFSLKSPPLSSRGSYSEASKYQRHPRSAVGWSPTHIYLVTVDGRQPGLSMGMKLAELAEYMVGLGCTEAMNLDGGKSAQMWLNGRIVNSPCQGVDTVANSLLVVRKPEER